MSSPGGNWARIISPNWMSAIRRPAWARAACFPTARGRGRRTSSRPPDRAASQRRQRVAHDRRVPEDVREHVAVHVLSRVAGVRRAEQLAPFPRAHHEGLMARRVAVRRNQDDAAVAEHVVVAVDHPVVERVVEVDRARAVARDEARTPRRLQLRALHEERRAREELVAAAVIEVEVRVRHVAHVVGRRGRAARAAAPRRRPPRISRSAASPARARGGPPDRARAWQCTPVSKRSWPRGWSTRKLRTGTVHRWPGVRSETMLARSSSMAPVQSA